MSSDVAYVVIHDDVSKNAWSAALLCAARTGPQDVEFPKNDTSSLDFVFSARMSEFRITNGKAEYKLRCCARFGNKAYNRKLSTEWDVWRRYSLVAALDSEVRRVLPMQATLLPPRALCVGRCLARRMARAGLDTYVCNVTQYYHPCKRMLTGCGHVCDLRDSVVFFQSGASAFLNECSVRMLDYIHLQALVDFDAYCKQEDAEFKKEEAPSRQKCTLTQTKKKPQTPPTPPPVEPSSPAVPSSKDNPIERNSPCENKNAKLNKGTRGAEGAYDLLAVAANTEPTTTETMPATSTSFSSSPPRPDRSNLLAQIQQEIKFKGVGA
ncbi:hypothetical protein H310_01485 [Aphanomyces invadans]|uniref:Uncharacterized protein n=1 Tax=Aphanomyces invadans TaxID=157072 RepID=A0A024URV2_9STRA|nr:hypothetical protein H310_01485 [Aphanomyces invadans]ETW09014.1 hypothetical protein H310_01485 [Aphanomyces invadans]|eukprot:XP_008862819.1 hypothetical protein H310_01485 [Aphanomyces invadans]